MSNEKEYGPHVVDVSVAMDGHLTCSLEGCEVHRVDSSGGTTILAWTGPRPVLPVTAREVIDLSVEVRSEVGDVSPGAVTAAFTSALLATKQERASALSASAATADLIQACHYLQGEAAERGGEYADGWDDACKACGDAVGEALVVDEALVREASLERDAREKLVEAARSYREALRAEDAAKSDRAQAQLSLDMALSGIERARRGEPEEPPWCGRCRAWHPVGECELEESDG